jgi:hypothetical protein
MIAALTLLAAVAAAGLAPATVEVHPAGPAVPENLLRIELRFARPQRLPFAVERLKLLDAAGSPLDNALLDLALPSSDGRRIGVLMDPGRVKRGAGPNRAAGRALHAGETVRLVVDAGDEGGPPVVKTWTVTEAVSHRLRAEAWRWRAPRAGSREPLVVDLREPVSASGELLVAVVDAAGRRVAGRAALSDGDAVWSFRPTRPWRDEAHRIVVHPELEDPAGNRSCAAFEQVRASEARCDAPVRLALRPLRGARPRR